MRNEYVLAAARVVPDPYILVNLISRRVKQLRRGARPLVESLEKLSPEDLALREVADGKISYELGAADVEVPSLGPTTDRGIRMAATKDFPHKAATPGAFSAPREPREPREAKV